MLAFIFVDYTIYITASVILKDLNRLKMVNIHSVWPMYSKQYAIKLKKLIGPHIFSSYVCLLFVKIVQTAVLIVFVLISRASAFSKIDLSMYSVNLGDLEL